MKYASANVFDLAGRQHGVASTAQLRAVGMSPNQIAASVRRGWLRSVHRGVYAVGHRPLSWRARWMAAVLACGEGAVLSHLAAAALWELGPQARTPIDVTILSAGGRRARPGLTVHRSHHFARAVRHAIGVTAPARTLLDIAAVVPCRVLERAVDEAERRRLCGRCDLLEALETDRGRPGAVALAAVLARHRIGSTLTRSALEERFLRLCREHELPAPQVNVAVLDFVVDFLWLDAGLVVEVDGHASHGTRAAFQRDRSRDARLSAAGYRVVRFTHRDVTSSPAVVANRVRSVRRLGLEAPGSVPTAHRRPAGQTGRSGPARRGT